MNAPLVTIGMPVYRGGDVLPVTLECIRTQSYRNLDVLISVDNADAASAEACRPFLADPRFRMHVQPARLGWAGNTDWTMRQRRGDFYVYQQHDDQVTPDYIAALVDAASRWPQASICYSEMERSGAQNLMVRDKPLTGAPLERALTHLERLDTSMFRGLMRGSALASTAGLLINEFDSFGSDHRLMTELAFAGEFRFVAGPRYFKRVHEQSVTTRFERFSEEARRAAWAHFGAWMIEVIVPKGASPEQRRDLFNTVLDRFLVNRGWLSFMRGRADWYRMEAAAQPVGMLRALIRRARRSGRLDAWLREQRRGMYCNFSNRDVAVRSALLREIMRRLRAGGRFEIEPQLNIDWEAAHRRAAAHFGLIASDQVSASA